MQSLAVIAAHDEIDFIAALACPAPFHFDDAIRIQAAEATQLAAISPVHADAAPAGDESAHRIAGQWLAATRQHGQKVANALDHQCALAGIVSDRHGFRAHGCRLVLCLLLMQDACNVSGADVAQGQGLEQFLKAAHLEHGRQAFQFDVVQGEALQFALQHCSSRRNVDLAIGLAEPVAHLVACTHGVEEAMVRVQPVASRLLGLAGEDLDAVAADWLEGQGHDAAIDLGAAAAVADTGVDEVGEVEHGRALGQVHHLPLGSQQVDPVIDDIGAEAGEQRGIVVGVIPTFQQLAHPGDLALEAGIATATFLVTPVRGKSEFGIGVHVVRADLHFQGAVVRADHRGMQRLVVVALRAGDVVIELAGNEWPQRVHDTERGVTGRNIRHQHAQRADVVKAGKIQALLLHLLPDRTDVLGATTNLGRDAGLFQGSLQQAPRLGDPGFAIRAALVQQLRDAPVGFRLQVTEGEVLKLPLELPDAEPIGQRRMDVRSQLRQRAPFAFIQFGGHAHAHELSRQQDEDHAQVADDGQQQATQAFCRSRRRALCIQRPDLLCGALAFDQFGHFGAECLQFRGIEFATGKSGFVQKECVARCGPRGQGFQDIEGRLALSTCGIPACARVSGLDQPGVYQGKHIDGLLGHNRSCLQT